MTIGHPFHRLFQRYIRTSTTIPSVPTSSASQRIFGRRSRARDALFRAYFSSLTSRLLKCVCKTTNSCDSVPIEGENPLSINMQQKFSSCVDFHFLYLQVMISEKSSSFLHFLTSVCAIVGGVFTVSGIVDAFIYQGEKIIRKKLELGKLS